MKLTGEQWVWGLLRISLAGIFLWAGLDKLFGLGLPTTNAQAWLNGASPTLGFLKFGTHGPLAPFWQNIAGSALVDWLFVLGLLGIGLALILGIVVRFSSLAAILMMLLIYSANLPPAHNPIFDEHIIYSLVALGLIASHAGQYLGVGSWWRNTQLVKKYPFWE